jgi:hypothetical protein
MKRLIGYAMATAMLASGFTASALAQAASTRSETATPTPDNAIMLTILLKHYETRPLAELKPAGESGICGLLGPVGRRSAHGTGSGESLS